MKVNVKCNKCKSMFWWTWGRQKGLCPKCGRINITDVKMAKGEMAKIWGKPKHSVCEEPKKWHIF